MRRSTAGCCWSPAGRGARHFFGRCCRFIVIQIFEKITFNTSYIASILKHRLMGFAPHAFGFHGDSHPTIDSLSQLTPGRYLSSPGSLARAVSRGGILRRSSPAAPLSRTALIQPGKPNKRQRRDIMHPLKKAARIAGAIYLSMVVTGPFSLIYVPNKLIVRGNAAATAENILAHETMFRLAILGRSHRGGDFHLPRHRSLSSCSAVSIRPGLV